MVLEANVYIFKNALFFHLVRMTNINISEHFIICGLTYDNVKHANNFQAILFWLLITDVRQIYVALYYTTKYMKLDVKLVLACICVSIAEFNKWHLCLICLCRKPFCSLCNICLKHFIFCISIQRNKSFFFLTVCFLDLEKWLVFSCVV